MNGQKDRFDKSNFDPKQMINKLHVNSPKLIELLKHLANHMSFV